jgi:rod shape determining protein RodA
MLIYFTKELKFKIIVIVSFLLLFSIITLFSISVREKLYLKQIIFFLFSIIFLIFLKNFSYIYFKKNFLYLIFVLVIFLNFLAFLFGFKKAWLKIYFFNFQPIEFAKIIFVLILSRELAYQKEIKKILSFLKYIFIIFIFSFLCYLQNDFGSLLVFLSIWFFLVFPYLNFKIKIFLISLILIFFLVFWFFIAKDYQKERILNFIYPEKDIFSGGYNAFESKTTFGSGGFFGKGFKKGYQSIYGFLPSAPTDFLLASFVEHFGYFGFLILIFLYILFWNQLEKLKDFLKETKEILFLKGFKIWIFTQFTINSLMNVGLLPIIGLPLPFFSYGGSHILAEILALKIIFDFSNKKF